ncbi:nucleoside-diphosphate sugar epimerase/dehydratase [Phaeobacter sp. J2-8]|uniref:polysaccharide biosynthesis protein n=1 Tax=Phaeobacter sp. J2-8 TaxID=2931394 RepID=UPI001FCFCAC5|nr:nucleoside-diphosphate sugar epimerase/dehydratase [Phaeobacter sp. J2-8]MCJ7871001.1 polysaccharide biosynthesis protein [Phaeobacter sp. J2-8]
MLYSLLVRMSRGQKAVIIATIDFCLVVLSFVGANSLLVGQVPSFEVLRASLPYLAVMGPVALAVVLYFDLHRTKLISYELKGVLQTALVAAAVGVSGLLTSVMIGSRISPQLFVIASMILLISSASIRLILREVVIRIYRRGKSLKRVLIYGAGRTGQQLASALLTDIELSLVGFVDDNPAMHGLTIAGFKVAPSSRVERMVENLRIDRIILAMPSASEADKARIAHQLSHLSCEVHIMPSFAQMLITQSGPVSTTPLDFSKLLGRNHLEAELPGVSGAYEGKCVMVTGAGGSIGSELCRQIASCQPSKVILFDHSELLLYNIQRRLASINPGVEIVTVLGSICEQGLVDRVFGDHDIDVVLHAAAYKHLPLLELNTIEGMRNNVIGTKLLADAARRNHVERFILISTDKAVRPTSVLGVTKRLAEMLIQDLATRSEHTMYSMVRFGNVLGSSGSVIPLFQDQIAKGGPVTVTHSDVTRYFMTVSEAVRLVLLAGSFARGGDVFVLDMGKPISIWQIARKLIENAGDKVRDAANPNGDIEIMFTGLRPGEKLEEELLIGTDMLTTPHPKILRAQETHLSELEMANVMAEVRKAVAAHDCDAANEIATRWVERRRDKNQQSEGTLEVI